MKTVTIILFFISFNARAWGGYDYESGHFIEIEKGNKVRSGNDIEVFNYSTVEYKNYEVEVYDWE